MVSNVDVSKTLTFHNLILRERKMHKICWTRFERISTQTLKNVMNLVFSRTVRKIHSGHRPDRSVTFICTPKCVFTILWPKSPAFWWSVRVDQPMFPTLPMGAKAATHPDHEVWPNWEWWLKVRGQHQAGLLNLAELCKKCKKMMWYARFKTELCKWVILWL